MRRTVITYNPDGTMSGVMANAAGTDRGEWDIDDDKLCVQWNTWEEGRRTCYSVYDREENEYRFNPGGGRMNLYVRVSDENS